MANEQNLIPMSQRTPEERREIARKGAAAANKVIAEKKAMKEVLKMMLSLPEKDATEKNKLKMYGIEDDELTIQASILIKQIEKAKEGSLAALEFIRDTCGERPAEKVQATVSNYEDTLRAVDGDEY